MLDVKAKLQMMEQSGAEFVEIIEGDYEGVVGISLNIHEHFFVGDCIFPLIQISLFAMDGSEYLVSHSDVKILSLEEFMEKANIRGGADGKD